MYAGNEMAPVFDRADTLRQRLSKKEHYSVQDINQVTDQAYAARLATSPQAQLYLLVFGFGLVLCPINKFTKTLKLVED
jgi:hypothetical protein